MSTETAFFAFQVSVLVLGVGILTTTLISLLTILSSVRRTLNDICRSAGAFDDLVKKLDRDSAGRIRTRTHT